MASKLEELVAKFKTGEIAPHVYVTDGATRDPECSVRGCNWYYCDHLDATLLQIVKEAVESVAP